MISSIVFLLTPEAFNIKNVYRLGHHIFSREIQYNFQMKGILSLALLAAIATTAASATMGNNHHHLEKRSPKTILPLLALKSGGSGASPLPPHIDPNIGQSSAQLNMMATSSSMSGPLAILGGLAILMSLFMAANYFQAVNAKRRAGYAYGGQYIQKRSSFNIDPESIVSFIDSFR